MKAWDSLGLLGVGSSLCPRQIVHYHCHKQTASQSQEGFKRKKSSVNEEGRCWHSLDEDEGFEDDEEEEVEQDVLVSWAGERQDMGGLAIVPNTG